MAATQKKKQQEVPAPQVEARIDRMVDGDYKTKAYASVTIAGAFAVHGLRVIETDKGRFISMPQESYKKNGETVYNDTFHAVTAEARTALVDAVNDAYEQRLQERIFAAQHISVNLIKHNLTTLKRLPHLTMLGLRKKENEYTYAPCTKQQAEELIRGLREIVPYVVIDCSSYIANDILSAVALMEADSVLQLASCDLKSVGYLSSQLPLLGELKWDKDKQYRVASNIKPFQAADRIGQVLGSVVFRLPYSQELEEQYLAGELLADLSMKDSRAFRKEIDRICEEVF